MFQLHAFRLCQLTARCGTKLLWTPISDRWDRIKWWWSLSQVGRRDYAYKSPSHRSVRSLYPSSLIMNKSLAAANGLLGGFSPISSLPFAFSLSCLLCTFFFFFLRLCLYLVYLWIISLCCCSQESETRSINHRPGTRCLVLESFSRSRRVLTTSEASCINTRPVLLLVSTYC